MSKVYTKTGDKGTTSLIGGTRVKKSDIRINSYGTVDELNSFVGLLATYIKEEEIIELLAEMQNVLFNIGCNLAMGDNFKKEIKEAVVTTKLIENVEHAIDRMQAAIPELKHFVIPGGSRSASIAHVCRTVYILQNLKRMLPLHLADFLFPQRLDYNKVPYSSSD